MLAAVIYSEFKFSKKTLRSFQYDFDGDGQTDQAVLGNLVTQTNELGETEEVFQPADDPANAEVQGVWLSANPEPGPLPDIIRRADTANRQQSTGYLSSISAEDLQDTDLMVFREATGELVLERQGLRDQEISGRKQIGEAEDGESLFYDLMIRGLDDSSLNIGGTDRRGSWTEWATRNQLAEPFREREANHLKPGEWIRLVAINRPTGYIATQRVQLSSAANNAGSLLNVPVEPLTLRPPNLKIWAERQFDITHGLTAGDERNYLIGAEGASLTSDSLIQVYTEWLAPDGRPLPGGLAADDGADFGLTGRLAKVVNTTLKPVGQGPNSDLANFPIAPGLHTQVIQIKDNQAVPEHFYIHVSGTPQNRTPAFDPGGASEALANRPGKLTPFKTPLFDESSDWQSFSEWHKVNEAEGDTGDDRTNNPEPVYQWHYRPEYQFSRFELEMKDIERQYTDEAGNTHTLDLLTGESDDGKVPTIRGDDDLVSIVYDLAGASFDRLSAIDGPQDLVFSLGGEEVQVTLGENQQITFENLEHIDRLHPADLLTMRLYTNQDAGNALWEYAFTRNGLHVYYKIPGNTEETNGTPERNTENRDDIEIVNLMAGTSQSEEGADDAPPPPTIRTLGGMRLRYRYLPPSIDGATIQSVTWRIEHRGRYCTEYGAEPTTQCWEIDAGEPFSLDKEYLPNESDNIYWEPIDDNGEVLWSLWAGESDDDEGVSGNLFAEYQIPGQQDPSTKLDRTYDQDFVIKTRELAPVTGEDAEPMEGSDVAMLEAMLWQFGISPQKGHDFRNSSFAGSEGNRINSDRGGDRGWTHSCDDERAEHRDVYYAGWENCSPGQVSTEGMVRRFQGRNEATQDGQEFDEVYHGLDADGIVDDAFFAHLAPIWREYYSAYQSNSAHEVVNLESQATEGWIDSALDVWESGNDGAGIPSTYTQTTHEEVLALTGQDGNGDMTRNQLFRAWKRQESTAHWGGGRPQSDYRISEGNADEFGSVGFSQIKYAFRYGQDSLRCEALEPFNLYDPEESIRAMLAFVSSPNTEANGTCTNSFYRGFAENGDWLELTPSYVDLRGYMNADDEVVAIDQARIDDHYERLMKGLSGYNGVWSLHRTWANMLRIGHTMSMGNGLSNRRYAMEIMRRYGIEGRVYVWFGGTYDESMPLTDEEGNIQYDEETDEPLLDPRAGEDWCFVYGEQEWMEPDFEVEDENGHQVSATFENYLRRATNLDEYRASCE